MPLSKNQFSKKTKMAAPIKPAEENLETEESSTEPTTPPKKIMDLDDDALPVAGEKIDDLEDFEGEEVGEDGEELDGSLDDEEIDPFGDKWEK